MHWYKRKWMIFLCIVTCSFLLVCLFILCCKCICQTVEMAGNDYGIININSIHRFSGFVNLIKTFFWSFFIFFLIFSKKSSLHSINHDRSLMTRQFVICLMYWFRSNICHFIGRVAYIRTSFKCLKKVSGATEANVWKNYCGICSRLKWINPKCV